MGMFDDIKCLYPLPVEGANAHPYQTKSTPAQFMDKYEIREDGSLWHENYEIEDHSEAGKWKRENPGKEFAADMSGLKSLVGCMTRVNCRWEHEKDFTGEIRFYHCYGNKPRDYSGWIEWSAYFLNGKLREINLIEDRKPTP